MRTLLLQEAKKEGISVPARTYKDTAKDALPPDLALIAEFMKKKFSTPPEVTQDEIKAFYDLFKAQMGGSLSKRSLQHSNNSSVRKAAGNGRALYERSSPGCQSGDQREASEENSHRSSRFKYGRRVQEGPRRRETVLVDFGANSCVPCREMRPVLNELGKEYTERPAFSSSMCTSIRTWRRTIRSSCSLPSSSLTQKAKRCLGTLEPWIRKRSSQS